MHRRIRRAAVCLAACTVMAAARYLIPVMQSVEIGRASPAAAETVPAPLTGTAPAAEQTLPVPAETVPVQLAPAAEAPAENACGIREESEGSQAMHFSRPYQSCGDGAGGEIHDAHFGIHTGSPFLSLSGGGQVRNCTFWDNSDLLAESTVMPPAGIKTDGTPVVLIYHTHTTESYAADKSGRYDSDFCFRTTEPDKNMVAVGNAIAAALAEQGIGSVHSAEIHDFPVWSGSYGNSAETVRAALEKYPDLRIVLDIHRDAISDGQTVTAPVCDVSGRQAAQIMIISGCDDGTMNMPDYRENFHMASIIEQTAEQLYPGFTRPVLFDYRKYNQDLTPGSLLIEVGSQGNTLEEAVYAGSLIGNTLAETIRRINGSSANRMPQT